LRALRDEPAQGLLDPRSHHRIQAVAEEFRRHADPQAAEVHVEQPRIVFRRALDARRVPSIEARHRVQQQREILCRSCHRAALIER
jgi:hypothetical protein